MLALPTLLALCTGASCVRASAFPARAGAPLEPGRWADDRPRFSDQQCAGGRVRGNSFSIPAAGSGPGSGAGCTNGHPRAERRFHDDYASGVRQFGGTMRVVAMSGRRVAVKQTFGPARPYFLLAVDADGRLYSVEGGATLAPPGTARPGLAAVRVHTVHDADAGRFSVYINGREALRDAAVPRGSFYDKIGAYTTNSGVGAMTVEWTDVLFWHRE